MSFLMRHSNSKKVTILPFPGKAGVAHGRIPGMLSRIRYRPVFAHK